MERQMKKLTNHWKMGPVFSITLVAFVLSFVGCADNSGVVSPEQQKAPKFFTRVTSFHKDPFSVGGWVGPWGGSVGGSSASYYNKVTFPPYALSRYTRVTLEMTDPTISQVELDPSMHFNRPVMVSLSYDGFNVTDPTHMAIYWYNPPTGNWDLITGSPTVDTNLKTVTFWTDHFSKYGFGDP
jgi:hypothetical protein